MYKNQLKRNLDFIYYIAGSVCLLFLFGFALTLGNKYAIGLTRLDGAFYAGHARLILDYPASSSLDSIPNLPAVKWIFATGLSYHRVGLASFQALLLGTVKTNENITTAVVGALGTYMLFSSFVYTGRKMHMNRTIMFLGSIFASLIPGYQMLAFENFYGAIVSVPILILFVALYWQTIKKYDFNLSILSGIVLSILPTIYMETVFYALASIIILIILQLLMFINKSIKKMATWLVPIIIACTLNIQFYRTVIIKEFSTNGTSPSGLDSIYPYAVSVIGLQRNLFGVTVENKILGLLSILFLFCGFFGLTYSFLKDKHTITIPFLAICLSCFVFLSTSQMSTYSFYRSLTMSYPLYVFGLALFFEGVLRFSEDKEITGLISSRVGKKSVQVICCAVLFIGILNSTKYLLLESNRYTLSWHQRDFSSGREKYHSVESNIFASDNETKEVYNKSIEIIEKNKNTDIVLSSDQMTEWAYTFPIFIGEKGYFMQEFYAKTLGVNKKYYGDSLKKLNTDNLVIIHIPPRDRKINDILPVSEWDNICVSTQEKFNKKENNYNYNVLSKKDANGSLSLYFSIDYEKSEVSNPPESLNIIFDNDSYEANYDENSNLYIIENIDVNILKGYQTFSFKSQLIIDNKYVPVELISTKILLK